MVFLADETATGLSKVRNSSTTVKQDSRSNEYANIAFWQPELIILFVP